MKQLPTYQTGKNYAHMGLEPHFLILDEYVAFLECLKREENNEVLSDMKKIIMLGRQADVYKRQLLTQVHV